MHQVPSLEILAHRIAWSLVFVAVVLTVRGQWAWLRAASSNPALLGRFLASASLLSCNWFLYIWAVNSNQVVEASLGYFINPLVSVLLGRVVLKERLRLAQHIAVGLAAIGVTWLTVTLGRPPWLALALAFSFGLYGLMRKLAPLGSLEGLSLETLLLAGPAIGYLVWLEVTGQGQFAHADALTNALLAGAGAVTAVPLLLFATATRSLPLSTVGVLQYMTPTMQFFIGVWVFHEPLAVEKLVGFVCIWVAVITFTVESLRQSRART